ncbi:hypothetical protein [Wolbachia endosymbiont (group B) of Erebia ligea]|uniref:hypothetical protein n=1 Tax=Wolbachia endosymbiont (group B) of Erebia ligea TaxID=2954010 RepID=UPI0021F839FD|nr:hypothetical protein [Wolbachia endosymbiont (group B) of Erebia ligea]
MLSLAAYLINSHLSAINSEKKVDPGREQSQDLQKAKELEQSNTYTSSLSVIAETPILPPPPPPPLPQNAAPLPPPPTASKYTEKPKNGAPEKANKYSALLEQIRKGTKLKPINDGAPEKAIDSEQNKSLPAGAKCHDYEIGKILQRRIGTGSFSSSESEVSDHSDSDDWSNDESKKPKEKKLTKSRKNLRLQTPNQKMKEEARVLTVVMNLMIM